MCVWQNMDWIDSKCFFVFKNIRWVMDSKVIFKTTSFALQGPYILFSLPLHPKSLLAPSAGEGGQKPRVVCCVDALCVLHNIIYAFGYTSLMAASLLTYWWRSRITTQNVHSVKPAHEWVVFVTSSSKRGSGHVWVVFFCAVVGGGRSFSDSRCFFAKRTFLGALFLTYNCPQTHILLLVHLRRARGIVSPILEGMRAKARRF